jgi:catechol 2,3-dioxygenase-like lactoylglutathione lyase family enzyme
MGIVMGEPGFVFGPLHHVQLAVRPGSETACRHLWGDTLGMRELAEPAVLAARGGCWFRFGSLEVHLGVEADFRPAQKARPEILVSDLQALANRFEAAGLDVTRGGDSQATTGSTPKTLSANRLEFLQPT